MFRNLSVILKIGFNLLLYRPNDEIICKGNDITNPDPNKIFFAVTFIEGNSNYPKYYSVSSSTSQSFQPSIIGTQTNTGNQTIFKDNYANHIDVPVVDTNLCYVIDGLVRNSYLITIVKFGTRLHWRGIFVGGSNNLLKERYFISIYICE